MNLPAHATTSTRWDSCLLLRVITDRAVMDSSFYSAMANAWRIDANSVFRQVTRNCYMATFQSSEEMTRIRLGGPWTYRGDLVAMATVKSHTELVPETADTADVWVQFYQIPVNSMKEEGLLMLARKLGTPISSPIDGFVNGKPFTKCKIQIRIADPCRDKLRTNHPELGEISILCAYEKITRICRFCGHIGHEMNSCPDHLKLSSMLNSPAHAGKYNSEELLAPKKGPWICNSSLIPQPEPKKPREPKTYKSKQAQYPHLKRPLESPPENKNSEVPMITGEADKTETSVSSQNRAQSPISKKPKPARPVSPAPLI